MVRDAGQHDRVPLSMSALLRLLGSATRLEVLAAIAVEPRTSRELAAALNLSVPMTFQHLLALYRHGLVVVDVREEGHVYHPSRNLRTLRVGHRVRVVMTVRCGDVLSLTLGPRN